MTKSPDASSSTNLTPDHEDALYLNALEEERQRLKLIQNLRHDYLRHLKELSDEHCLKNSGTDETNRLLEIEGIRQRV